MEQKYIDEFFNAGRLRLSSFALFASYSDEQRGDKSEGHNVLVGFGDGHTIMAKTSHGHNSYILCASTVEDKQLMKDFGTDGYFRIVDSTNFGAAIANKIPGFLEGLEGYCIYSDDHIIKRNLPNFKFDDLKSQSDNDKIDLNKIFALTGQIGLLDVYFMKQKKFITQSEYRFIWNISNEVEEKVFITCSEAIQFCEKVT
jgi:hypothetical protein